MFIFSSFIDFSFIFSSFIYFSFVFSSFIYFSFIFSSFIYFTFIFRSFIYFSFFYVLGRKLCVFVFLDSCISCLSVCFGFYKCVCVRLFVCLNTSILWEMRCWEMRWSGRQVEEGAWMERCNEENIKFVIVN